ncbi:hypothetical protein DXT99_22860 [Pontibacter diazotrophicus]|uniref:Uncharacterized protein n=1 Tax=Pontibacter diazotrophicus TaxID=1400979 RepID=A0A3D8L3Q7_9BACT|nr:hypothetical protein [Pontibacter diazotrophicus]RDV11976.1 hypothetical protein DXT99_22860 [Pontibacter diazotrophicus]
MKKLFFASAVLLGSISLYSCDGGGTTTEEGTVVQTDTTVSELEVERTTMEVDTTMDTETETIDIDNENQ